MNSCLVSKDDGFAIHAQTQLLPASSELDSQEFEVVWKRCCVPHVGTRSVLGADVKQAMEFFIDSSNGFLRPHPSRRCTLRIVQVF